MVSFLYNKIAAKVEMGSSKRVLRYFCRRGFFSKTDIETMLTYDNSGFSLDASVKVESFDKEALERLIRYCARPPFKSENLRWYGKSLEYTFPKPSIL